jgi:hypothetical protein
MNKRFNSFTPEQVTPDELDALWLSRSIRERLAYRASLQARLDDLNKEREGLIISIRNASEDIAQAQAAMYLNLGVPQPWQTEDAEKFGEEVYEAMDPKAQLCKPFPSRSHPDYITPMFSEVHNDIDS